jgi:hypothetical protein
MPQVDDDYRKKASLARFKQRTSKATPENAMLGAAGVAKIGANIATPLIGRVAGPIMQRALDVAEAEGRSVGGSILGNAAAQGVKYSQSNVPRAGKAAQEELFNFLKEMERMGVKPQTANKFLKGISEYVDDPVQGMSTLGADIGRSSTRGIPAKQALVDRFFSRLGNAAEDSFF